MTPLERAARALAVENGHDPDKQISHVSPPAPIWTLFVDSARAVLTAIKYAPNDDAFSNAAAAILPQRGDKAMVACEIWTAMIDAILAGGE